MSAAGPFTAEELQAFENVFGYLESEGENDSYVRNPHPNHIWLQVLKARAAVARVVQDFEQKATEGAKV